MARIDGLRFVGELEDLITTTTPTPQAAVSTGNAPPMLLTTAETCATAPSNAAIKPSFLQAIGMAIQSLLPEDHVNFLVHLVIFLMLLGLAWMLFTLGRCSLRSARRWSAQPRSSASAATMVLNRRYYGSGNAAR